MGIGTQVFCSLYAMLLLFTLHFASNPYVRPYIFVFSLVALAMMGGVNGFVTARVIKFFGETNWCSSILIAATVFPTWLLLTFGVIDIFEWIE